MKTAIAASSALNRIPRPLPARSELRGESSAPTQPRWLTDPIVQAVYHARGTVKAIALALQVRESAVYEIAHGLTPRALKAWWIPAIVQETGSFAVLDALEAQVGRIAFQIPVAVAADQVAIVIHTANAAREFGEALTRVGAALADGTITDDERAHIEQEIDDVHASLAALRHVIRKGVAA